MCEALFFSLRHYFHKLNFLENSIFLYASAISCEFPLCLQFFHIFFSIIPNTLSVAARLQICLPQLERLSKKIQYKTNNKKQYNNASSKMLQFAEKSI